MNRRSFIAKLVGAVAASALTLKMATPEPKWRRFGAETGRMSCTNLIVLGNGIGKSAFIPDTGYIFVQCDLSLDDSWVTNSISPSSHV